MSVRTEAERVSDTTQPRGRGKPFSWKGKERFSTQPRPDVKSPQRARGSAAVAGKLPSQRGQMGPLSHGSQSMPDARSS